MVRNNISIISITRPRNLKEKLTNVLFWGFSAAKCARISVWHHPNDLIHDLQEF